ncbi:DUF5132 domain-containing protein [Umezakia ovalisporum]|jgi:hypothetical protein|uniref:DUF5132 domain-containing protein n=2 Tax=Umezakia ovalisporum TaxID=75695 RepID=A0AA43GVA5_9CYAN|nr:DUF5132 domain-containing protein [Umezakia ovalisporum]MDH6056490.1 DUF5132 domain-containing protein [Umezakia ovalisporum FSS-43]MDH6062275.1 DUF5132 domain-containing protein [Umezakia ovalisporum FSS-62]MDH6067877.1 DUF5132 domain-containing protein [Umezakia ovalisporum APH033B]MDH6072766.1 DUF5132 domain-containing protein [Umezakia ovalisporum CobakiLakeA]MDH6073621.1 DUF5132 domain-containing protein [Umezakia ovalisporum CS-1034]
MAPKIPDFVEDAGASGIIVSIGALLLAPVLIPVVAGIGKPIAKSLVKGGIVAYEKSRGAFAEMGETWEDIIAEAKAEIAEERQAPAFEATSTSGSNTEEHGA